MSLIAYNLTTAPLALAAGAPIPTLPASAITGARSAPVNVTGSLKALTAPDFALLQVQVAAGHVQYEWSGLPEFNVFTLVVGSAQEDASDLPIDLYSDPTTGVDTNPGSLAAPVQTFETLMNKKPAIYYQSLRFHLNIDPTTSAQNTAKKVYTLSAQALQFLFPEMEGSLGESVLVDGGFTNELGDKTSGQPGSTTILLNTSETLAANYAGAQLTIVSGTGAGQKRIIRSNTQVVNSSIVPEGVFTIAPDATSVFRIGYPNVQIRWSQRLLFAAPPQNLFMRGIEFVFAGAGTSTDFQLGNILGLGGGGATVFTGCTWNMGSGGNKANMRVRGTARAQLSGDSTYWTGPNNPFTTDDANMGCYYHDATALSTNVGGQLQATGCLIQNTGVQARSFSAQIWQATTFENAPIQITNCATFDLFSLNVTQRARVRLRTGTAVSVTAIGFSTAPNAGQPGFNNVEFSDITGDLFVLTNNATAYLGDISVAGVNTGVGLKVQSGSSAVVGAATLLAGTAGAMQIDSGPILTLAQALAAPFNGTLRSNAVTPNTILDPGNAGAISVAVDGVCLLTSAGAETRTMAAPSYVGQKIALCCNVFVGNIAVTVSAAFNMAGNTVATYTAAGQTTFFEGVRIAGALRWRMMSNDGATLT